MVGKSSPTITYEIPNEVGADIILIEKGEYKCRTCNSIIAFYRNSISKKLFGRLKLFIYLSTILHAKIWIKETLKML
jgi:hypothetical protein